MRTVIQKDFLLHAEYLLSPGDHFKGFVLGQRVEVADDPADYLADVDHQVLGLVLYQLQDQLKRHWHCHKVILNWQWLTLKAYFHEFLQYLLDRLVLQVGLQPELCKRPLGLFQQKQSDTISLAKLNRFAVLWIFKIMPGRRKSVSLTFSIFYCKY